MFSFKDVPIKVSAGDKVRYTDSHIFSSYRYEETSVSFAKDGSIVARPEAKEFTLRTARQVPRLGVMVVGLGGNNGSTLAAGEILSAGDAGASNGCKGSLSRPLSTIWERLSGHVFTGPLTCAAIDHPFSPPPTPNPATPSQPQPSSPTSTS